MDTIKQHIENYTSDGFRLFDSKSDAVDKSEKLLITSTLEREVSINKFFTRFNSLTPNCKELIVIERIVDIDDTFTNALQFLLDKTHARFYTVPEIVSEFCKRFFMNEYNVYAEPIDIDKSRFQPTDALNRLIDTTDNIRRFINLKEYSNRVTMNKIFGEFRFIKL